MFENNPLIKKPSTSYVLNTPNLATGNSQHIVNLAESLEFWMSLYTKKAQNHSNKRHITTFYPIFRLSVPQNIPSQVTQPTHKFLAAPTQKRRHFRHHTGTLSVRGRFSQVQKAVHDLHLAVELHLLLHAAIVPVEAGLSIPKPKPKPRAVVVDRQGLSQRELGRLRLLEVGEEIRRQAVARLLGQGERRSAESSLAFCLWSWLLI
jgi:hypothetical protein